MQVKNLMGLHPYTVHKDETPVGQEDPIETALALMLQNKRYRRVLVVDQSRRLLGTLTRSDFLRLFVRGA